LTFTPNKNIETPAHGADVNTWDVNANANFTLIDECFSGTLLLNATGLSGAQVLTQVNVQPPFIQISGTPTAAITYEWPAAIGGSWVVQNLTTGGFQIGVQMAGPIGALILIPAGQQLQIITDGGANGLQLSNSVFDSSGVHFPDGTVQKTASALTGVVMAYAFAIAPVWALLCQGQAVSRATYAALNTLMSAAGYPYGNGDGSTTFNVPDLRGRVIAALDNGAGRLNSAVITPNANTLGGAGGIQFAGLQSGFTSAAAGPDFNAATQASGAAVVQPTMVMNYIIGI
jgi:microcystin-dependent protein